jgi:hypothetical protein
MRLYRVFGDFSPKYSAAAEIEYQRRSSMSDLREENLRGDAEDA